VTNKARDIAPDFEHILDWFHIPARILVMYQNLAQNSCKIPNLYHQQRLDDPNYAAQTGLDRLCGKHCQDRGEKALQQT